MNMPGFTADASLDKQSNRWIYQQKTFGGQWGKSQRTMVAPQLGGPDFQGFQICVNECRDTNPSLTIAQCRSACRDSGVGDPPSAPGSSPFSDALCYTFYAACILNPFSFGCKAVLDDCLETNKRR
jgi:hypothetical protein